MLDTFGGYDSGATSAAYTAWRNAEDALALARADLATAAQDREWLDHAVTELDRLAPEPGEEEALADRRRTMQRAEKIADDIINNP